MLAHDLLDDLDRRADAALLPLYLVVGDETFLAEEVVRKLQKTARIGGIEGFNEDRFTAGESHVDAVLGAAKSMPMMAKRRFVLVRSVERWESKAEDGEEAAAPKGRTKAEGPMDRLASYAADPSPACVLVLVATKLHGGRKIVTMAKKAGFIVQCEALRRGEATPWVMARAKRLGHGIDRRAAEHLAELVGNDLGSLADAVERMSLFVGPEAAITEDAVATMIAPVKSATVWSLIDSICARDLPKTMRLLGDMELGRGAELMTLGAIALSVRKLVNLADRLASGEAPQPAAEAAGFPGFKAREMAQTVRSLPKGTLTRWLELLAETDVALKGGARRGSRAVLEGMIVTMCAAK